MKTRTSSLAKTAAIVWTLALVTLFVLVTSDPANAGGYYRRGTFVMGGGFNFPVGDMEKYLDSSGSLMIAGGRHLDKFWTAEVEWTHNWHAVDPAIYDHVNTDSVSFSNAYATDWSMTLNLIRRFRPEHDIVPWITGGVGYYKRNIQLTQNAYVYFPPIWDPWWGWIDGGWAPGEVVTGSREQSGFGFNVGGGIDLAIENGAALFIDARYHQANLEGVKTTMIPVLVGVRW